MWPCCRSSRSHRRKNGRDQKVPKTEYLVPCRDRAAARTTTQVPPSTRARSRGISPRPVSEGQVVHAALSRPVWGGKWHDLGQYVSAINRPTRVWFPSDGGTKRMSLIPPISPRTASALAGCEHRHGCRPDRPRRKGAGTCRDHWQGDVQYCRDASAKAWARGTTPNSPSAGARR